MDRRKTYYLTIDTETANSLDDPLMYDIGGCIHDRYGRVEECFSFVIYEVFCADRAMFDTAYYADKRPNYEDDIANGLRKIVTLWTAKRYIADLCRKYNVRAIIAHNARFDYKSTNTTLRYYTASKYRYFLPYGVEIWDTLKMARDTICQQKAYRAFCKENHYICNNGQLKSTAEILYRYITRDTEFVESHTGLEDVMIEKEIFAKCMAQHKKMRKKLWAD